MVNNVGSFTAQVAEVSVEQGQVRVHRVVCAVDCGHVVNPAIVEQQIQSGIVFGLTAALKGGITIDKGRVQQRNFNDYDVLRIDEMPVVEVHIVPSHRPRRYWGSRLPAIAPAVAMRSSPRPASEFANCRFGPKTWRSNRFFCCPGLICDQTVWQQQIDALSDVAVCTCADYGELDSLTGHGGGGASQPRLTDFPSRDIPWAGVSRWRSTGWRSSTRGAHRAAQYRVLAAGCGRGGRRRNP